MQCASLKSQCVSSWAEWRTYMQALQDTEQVVRFKLLSWCDIHSQAWVLGPGLYEGAFSSALQ